MIQLTPSDLYTLVPCAGTGERAGTLQPKQYAPLAGQSVVAHTLRALSAVQRIRQILVVLNPNDSAFELHAPNYRGGVARVGGTSRAESVANGLDALAQQGARAHDWVLVHDAARCLVRPEWVNALIDACWDDDVGGLLALPVADTLNVEASGRMVATLNRNDKWQAQTPQMFRLGDLQEALAQAGPQVTDESSAMQARGYSPKLVRGALENFKITFPSDFALAERLLRTRE